MESSIDSRSASRGEPFNHATPISRRGSQCSKMRDPKAAPEPAADEKALGPARYYQWFMRNIRIYIWIVPVTRARRSLSTPRDETIGNLRHLSLGRLDKRESESRGNRKSRLITATVARRRIVYEDQRAKLFQLHARLRSPCSTFRGY